MAKSSKRRRTERAAHTAKVPTQNSVNVVNDDTDQLIGGVVFLEELETTIETLQILTRNPDLLKSRQFKGIKTAVWDFHRASTEAAGVGTSVVSRVSHALTDARYTDALVLLSEMRIRNQRPKLGTLQRWVRECDAASKREGEVVWEVLQAILQTTQYAVPETSGSTSGTRRLGADRDAIVRRCEEWICREPTGQDLWHELQTGDLFGGNRAAIAAPFLPLLITPAHLRRPPNVYPSTIWYSPSNPLALITPPHPAQRHDVPDLPGAFLLTDVLSHTEARAMVRAAEAVGLEKDKPAGGSAIEMESILAENMIWLADPEFLSTVFARIGHLLPQVMDGGEVTGLNARFRIYRYTFGAQYRPHIDGAWPASGLSNTTPPEYVYDSDPALYSRLTFLLYLNDGFPGGCTTFFTPTSRTTQTLDARPVRPVMGAALVFPHGATAGSLLHEGSGVGENSAKWVIRTEVLYKLGAAGRGGADVIITG